MVLPHNGMALMEVKYWYLEHPEHLEHLEHCGSCPRGWEVTGNIDEHIYSSETRSARCFPFLRYTLIYFRIYTCIYFSFSVLQFCANERTL